MKKKIAFLCVHNSCRSQMAEGWMKELGSDIFETYSAGTEEYLEVKPLAVEAMKEIGIDISDQYPKLIEDITRKVDYLITMGCNVVCPYIPNTITEDWGIEDPSGGTIQDFRKTRDEIKNKIIDLINRERSDKN